MGFLFRFLRSILAVFALAAPVFVQSTSVGCSDARFPYCKTDEDCKDKGDAKLCADTRCVQCKYDGDCGDGKYCERKVGECKVLDTPGHTSAEPPPPPPPEPEPTASASTSSSAVPPKKKK